MTDDENCIHGYSTHSIVAFQRRLSSRNSLVVSTAVATVTFFQSWVNAAITGKVACMVERKMPHIRSTGWTKSTSCKLGRLSAHVARLKAWAGCYEHQQLPQWHGYSIRAKNRINLHGGRRAWWLCYSNSLSGLILNSCSTASVNIPLVHSIALSSLQFFFTFFAFHVSLHSGQTQDIIPCSRMWNSPKRSLQEEPLMAGCPDGMSAFNQIFSLWCS